MKKANIVLLSLVLVLLLPFSANADTLGTTYITINADSGVTATINKRDLQLPNKPSQKNTIDCNLAEQPVGNGSTAVCAISKASSKDAYILITYLDYASGTTKYACGFRFILNWDRTSVDPFTIAPSTNLCPYSVTKDGLNLTLTLKQPQS